MKKRVKGFFSVFLIVAIIFVAYSNIGSVEGDTLTGDVVTGDAITGNATSSNVAVSVTIADTTEEAPSGGGGGGGGGVSSFSIDNNQISVTLKPGQVKTENITVTNNGTRSIRIVAENLFNDFVIRIEDAIDLNPGESKTIPIYLVAREDTIPDLYLGKIILSSGDIRKEVLIAIEVESEGILLDVRAEILRDYKDIFPGGEILAEMRLFNLGVSDERKDVIIEYIIKDYEGIEVFKQTESLAIETQLSFIKRIPVSQNIKLGKYVLYVKAIYDGKTASSSDNFEIISSKTTIREKVFAGVLIIIIASLILVIYYRIKRNKKNSKKGIFRIFRSVIRN